MQCEFDYNLSHSDMLRKCSRMVSNPPVWNKKVDKTGFSFETDTTKLIIPRLFMKIRLLE